VLGIGNGGGKVCGGRLQVQAKGYFYRSKLKAAGAGRPVQLRLAETQGKYCGVDPIQGYRDVHSENKGVSLLTS